jgi:hypothetical protein
LDVLYFLQLGPVLDSFNFILGHFKTIGRQDIAQILNRLRVELAFIGARIKAALMEVTEDITDLLGWLVLDKDGGLLAGGLLLGFLDNC